MNLPEKAIVVGVPAEGGDAALRFAVEEARRSGAPVHLVHVVQIPGGELYTGVYEGVVESAHAVIESAHRRAKELSDGAVPVTYELADHGWVVGELVARSDNARMVVVEHRDLGRLRRFFTGSRSSGVAARARSAVVTVPAGWHPATGRDTGRHRCRAARGRGRGAAARGLRGGPPARRRAGRPARVVAGQRVRRHGGRPGRPRRVGGQGQAEVRARPRLARSALPDGPLDLGGPARAARRGRPGCRRAFRPAGHRSSAPPAAPRQPPRSRSPGP